MAVLAALVVVGIFALFARGRSRLYRYAGGLALAGHVLFALVVLPVLPYSWDIGIFHDIAVGILAGGDTSPFSPLDAFGTVQALLYAVFGADPAVVSVFNGLLAVMMAPPACYLAGRLYDTESTDGVVLAVLFLPFPFLFHSLPMRDALATLLALTTLAVCVRVLADRQYPWAATLPPLWAMVLLLREELALLILLGVGGAALAAALARVAERDVTLTSLALAAIPVALCGFALFASLFPVGALNERLQYRTFGGAAYLEFMRYESWLDVVLAAPVRALYFQYAPFPLHVDSAFDLVGALFTPVLVVLTVTALVSLRSVDTDPLVALLLLTVYAGGVVGYGLIDANFGTTIRHRAVFVFLLVVFSTPVVESWYRSLRRWLDDALDQRRDGDKQQGEAEKLDAGP
jgi:hypothetical protein